MILAGVVLLSVGGADLVRQFIGPRWRWVAYAASGLILLALTAGLDAVPAAVIGALVATAWVLVVKPDGTSRAGIWAAAALALGCAIAVVAAPPRPSPGPLAHVWQPAGPFGVVPLDTLVTAAGAVAFLLESGNILVRSALRREMALPPAGSGLKGGRLIGPLERVLVFALTLAGAYTLLAAVLAAKGIVRFPEISRDGESGDRAEYFLVGSLVSWVAALGAALLVWWGAAS